jgi:hypothetical protein
MSVEILIGRGLACCAHPTAAWQRLTPAKRALLLGAYVAFGYVSALAALVLS